MVGDNQPKQDETRYGIEKDGGDMSSNNDEMTNLNAGITNKEA